MGEAWRKKTQNRIIFVFDFFPKSGISSAFLAELGYISTSVTAMTPRRHLIGQRWPPPTTRRWPHFRRLNRLVLTTLNNTQKSPDYSIPLENGRRPTMATHIRRVEDPIFRISGGGGGTHIHKTSKKRYPITRLLYSTKKKKMAGIVIFDHKTAQRPTTRARTIRVHAYRRVVAGFLWPIRWRLVGSFCGHRNVMECPP